MSKRKKKQEPYTPPPMTKAEREAREDRFAWVGDDVLHLVIDGANVKSSPL